MELCSQCCLVLRCSPPVGLENCTNRKGTNHLSFRVLYFGVDEQFLVEGELKAGWILTGSSFKAINSRSQTQNQQTRVTDSISEAQIQGHFKEKNVTLTWKIQHNTQDTDVDNQKENKVFFFWRKPEMLDHWLKSSKIHGKHSALQIWPV